MSDDDEGPLHPLNYNGKNLGTSEEWQHNMSNLGRGKPRINPNDPPSSSAPPSASSAPGNDAPGEDDLVDTDDDSIAVGQKRKHHCLVYDDDESEAEYEYNPFVLSEAKETGCREAEVKAVDEALMPNGKTWIANEDSDLGEDSGEESEEEEAVDESSEGLVPESEVADQIVGLTPLARAVQEVELLAPPRAEVDLLLDQREEEHEARKRKRRKLERDEMERVVVHNHTFNQRNESGSSVTNNVNNSSTTHHHHNTFVVDPAALHQIEMQQWQRQQQLLLMMQQQQQRAVTLRQPPFNLAKYGQQCRDASEATQILTAPSGIAPSICRTCRPLQSRGMPS